MSSSAAIYISHMPQDRGLASQLQAHLRDRVFERDPNSPHIKTAFFILNLAFLYDATAERTTLAFLNRPDVWCIPLFYHLGPHDLLNLCRTPQAKPFWQAMKNLKGEVFDRRDETLFVQQVVSLLRNGPRGAQSISYDVFLSHAGEVKPFCEKLNTMLHQQGITSFLDKFDVTGGPNSLAFSEEIQGAIERSKVVVAVLSHHFPSKKWPVLEIVQVRSKSREGAKVLPVYYQISQVQCVEIVNYARAPQGRDALAWLFAQPGIEHFGKHAGEQESEDELLQTIVHSVSSLLQGGRMCPIGAGNSVLMGHLVGSCNELEPCNGQWLMPSSLVSPRNPNPPAQRPGSPISPAPGPIQGDARVNTAGHLQVGLRSSILLSTSADVLRGVGSISCSLLPNSDSSLAQSLASLPQHLASIFADLTNAPASQPNVAGAESDLPSAATVSGSADGCDHMAFAREGLIESSIATSSDHLGSSVPLLQDKPMPTCYHQSSPVGVST